MLLKCGAIVLVWVGMFCGSVEANIVGSNISSSTSIIASNIVGTLCSATNSIYSSLSCSAHTTQFDGWVSAEPSKIWGRASLGSIGNPPDFYDEIEIAASFSEMLTVNGGTPGSSAYLALPLIALFSGDATSGSAVLGNQVLSRGDVPNYPGPMADFTGYLISQFQYGVPFGFTLQASSSGDEGGNSLGLAEFFLSFYAPIVLPSIPGEYAVGFNKVGGEGFFDPALPPLGELRPAGPNGAADVIAPIPEPNTMILTAVLVCLTGACGGGFRLKKRAGDTAKN